MKFTEIESQVDSVNNISDLLKLWQLAHECDPYVEDTLPYIPYDIPADNLTSLKSSLCVDGTTTLDGHYIGSDRADVMFILKEHNRTNEISYSTVKKIRPFWFNESDDRNRTKYFRRFTTILNVIYPDFDQSSPIGYMNINKRGGMSNTNRIKFTNYIRQYHKFITKQIDLTDPKIILLCGCWEELSQGLYETGSLNDLVKDGRKILEIPHPSSINFSTELSRRKEEITRWSAFHLEAEKYSM